MKTNKTQSEAYRNNQVHKLVLDNIYLKLVEADQAINNLYLFDESRADKYMDAIRSIIKDINYPGMGIDTKYFK